MVRHGVVALLVAALCSTASAETLADISAAAPRCETTVARCFEIRLHVALDGDTPVVSASWFAAQLATANAHFASAGIGFQLAGIDALPASALHVVTRADRNALAKGRLGEGVIHVHLVGVLDDVDVAGEKRNGVAWRLPRDARKYLIVSSQARPLTLAHELGHLFGLPHTDAPASIMNKTPRTEPPVEERTFPPEELEVIRKKAAALVRAKTLTPVTTAAM